MSEIFVTGFATTPVKGMRIHEVDSIELSRNGARGDRAFYLIDDRGRMVNGKVVRDLQVVVPAYDPDTDELTLTFPGGARVRGRVALGAPVQTQFFGRPRTAPEVIGPWAEAISAFFDRPLRMVAAQTAVDRGIRATASVVSRGSLQRLAEQAECDTVDGRRFRMLIEVDGVAPHEEDTWVGRRVEVGPASLAMHGHIGRCLITSRDPETAEVDLPTLELLAAYRREIDSTEPLPFGIYGEVLEGGTVRIGDPVTVETLVPAGGR
ncbi:MAG: MOSC N-terminal beta barrel domain-containing protein [Solirubrobacteraceae bacterium]